MMHLKGVDNKVAYQIQLLYRANSKFDSLKIYKNLPNVNLKKNTWAEDFGT